MKQILIILAMFAALGLRGQNSAAELIGSHDEVEVYAHLNDTHPQIVSENMQYYREKYLSELRDNGHHITFDCWVELLDLKVLNKDGYILRRVPRILNEFTEKTVFDFSELLEGEDK